jgi:small multidrug resistance family-3 protein
VTERRLGLAGVLMALCCLAGPAVLGAVAGAAIGSVLGVVATLQPENEFGRVLAAYGGVFIVGSICWGIAFDSFRPDRYDLAGAAVCLVGVGIIMYAPR